MCLNYGTLENTMVLWEELLYYGKKLCTILITMDFGLRRKKHGRLPKTMNLWWIIEIINVIYPQKWSLWSNLKLYKFDLLWKTMENYDTMNKLWFYEKNYGATVNNSLQ